MEKEFIPYEQALALKKLGFIESCFAYYNNHSPRNNHQRGFIISQHSIQDHNEETEGDDLICSAPLYQQAFRWFREKYGIYQYIKCTNTKRVSGTFEILITKENETKFYHYGYETYEEAELECLKELIKIVK